jgi:hypothetical protein
MMNVPAAAAEEDKRELIELIPLIRISLPPAGPMGIDEECG